MHIDTALRVLRGNTPAQHMAQQSMERALTAWASLDYIRTLRCELSHFAAGEAWDDCPALNALIGCHAQAKSMIDQLIGEVTQVLEDFPLAHLPFRHQFSNGVAMIQLLQAGPAVIALLAYDETAAVPFPQSVSFSDVERHEIVLAGAAELRIVELREERGSGAVMDATARRVCAGETMHFGPRATRYQQRIHGRMIVLRVARSPLQPGPSRAFRLDSGALVHRASGDRAESQREMAMAALGRMGRTDAAPLFAEVAQEGSDHFRWQTLRECLALDPATGFAALSRCAADPDDKLAPHAAALRAQLLETYPQFLTSMELQECLA